jgi:hypothetical protein
MVNLRKELYISRISAWAPGVTTPEEWAEWARGGRKICVSDESPKIAFTGSLFRRRLSQLSRMTIQVVHDLMPVAEAAKMIFLSFRGELSMQYKINKMLIEENVLLPAAFSLSVFNAPAALASIALGLSGGYSALFPGKDSFSTGLIAAGVSCKPSGEILFVYADEAVAPEYRNIFPGSPEPLAFGFLLSGNFSPGALSLPEICGEDENNPANFLRHLILCRQPVWGTGL